MTTVTDIHSAHTRRKESKAANIDRGHYMFGGCPECHKPLLTSRDGNGPDISGTDTLAVRGDDFGVCHNCKVYWLVGSGHFGGAYGEEAERNMKVLDDYRRVEPFIP